MTLTDLLVSIAMSGVILGGTFLLLEQGQQAYTIGAARVETQQGVRLALTRMAAEIRGAGYARSGASFPALGLTEPTRLVIQHDLDGDGAVAANGERITYLLRGTTLRRDAGGGAQPVLNGVSALRFTYLDAERRPAETPDRVRSVMIEIAARPTRLDTWFVPSVVARATTEVRLRNR